MEYLYIAILGAVQGATEFLPVSSSGHLAAGQMIMEVEALASQPLLLEILLHLATLLAVVIIYRKDVWGLVTGFGRFAAGIRTPAKVLGEDPGARLLLLLVIGSVPTAIIGLVFEKTGVAGAVAETPLFLGLSFITCAGILMLSRLEKTDKRAISIPMALLIGVAQGLAVMPGISRSGTTIAIALLLGVNREDAAKFSFLLSIPAILGAAVLKMDVTALASSPALGPILVGVSASFVVGLLALLLLIKLVRAGRFWLFAPYVATIGCCTIAFF